MEPGILRKRWDYLNIMSDYQNPIIYMASEVIYSQNKHLAYFHLDPSVSQRTDPLLQPPPYVTFIFHNHYPVVYFEELHNHFQHCLPHVKAGNIRICFNKQELPYQLPMGLYLHRQEGPFEFTVTIDERVQVPEAFRVLKNSWKKAFEVINFDRRSDYVKTRLSENETKKKYMDYYEGRSNNLHNEGLYEGSYAIVRGFVQGNILERKYAVKQFRVVGEIIKDLFDAGEEAKVFSHGMAVPSELSTRFFLDEWNYNDGHCYLLLDL